MQLKCFKNGELVDCSLGEFVQGMRHHSGWAEEEFKTRSDPAAHLGDILRMAADAIDELENRLETERADHAATIEYNDYPR